ncbi:hypothetical protein [Methylocapsa sp. S129]|uniref:hypothetical protein n=1 Tax=Methylocapsa sp. S129 TaxID=1641869 RepID=UPI00131D5649|nr:hypothetical protein [Methylocapsa sp. S129]
MTDMSVATFAPARDRAPSVLRIGDVFSRSRKMYAAHWAAYTGIVTIANAPFLAIGAIGGYLATIGRQATPSAIGAAIVGGLFALACLMLAHAAIYAGVSQEISGRPFAFGQSISAALRRSPAFLALILLLWLYAALAVLLLVIPALIVLCVYVVAFPACIVERLGPIQSLSRSAFLTKGNRWRIFGLLIVLYLGTALASQLIIFLAKLAGGAIFSALVSLPIQGFVGSFSAVTIGVLYAQLRVAREGVDIEPIAKVFD